MSSTPLKLLGSLTCAFIGPMVPGVVSAQVECPVDCDQKYEAGLVQHRLGAGEGWEVGPEWHTDWYVNPCQKDHECAPELWALDVARIAVERHDVHALAALIASTPSIVVNAARNGLDLMTCQGTVVGTIAVPRSLIEQPEVVRAMKRPLQKPWTTDSR